jgi:hypothetical protein
MKKSTFLKAFGLLSLLFVFTACNKYEEGSNFSLISAKSRVSNTWTSSSYTVSSSLSTVTSDNSSLTITKDGNFTNVGTFLGLSADAVGTWTFNSDKTQLLLTETGGDTVTWTIVKLKNKELKITQTENILGADVTTTIEYTGS